MKLPNIVLTPMEESPTMLETWARLKHLGRVRVSTVSADYNEIYRTTLEFLDGRILSDQNEDLYRTFLNIYRRVVREREINEGRENRLIEPAKSKLVYNKAEKIWYQQSNEEGIETIYQSGKATIGTFVTAHTTTISPTNHLWSCQGWIICESPLKVMGRNGRVYECCGKPTIVANPPQTIPEVVIIELDKARGIEKKGVKKCQDIW